MNRIPLAAFERILGSGNQGIRGTTNARAAKWFLRPRLYGHRKLGISAGKGGAGGEVPGGRSGSPRAAVAARRIRGDRLSEYRQVPGAAEDDPAEKAQADDGKETRQG